MIVSRVCFLACLLAALLVAGALPSAPASAQQATDLAIAVLDVQRVRRDAAAAQGIRAAVEAERTRVEDQIEAARRQILADEEQLRQQQAILAPEVLNQRRADLERRYQELRRRADQTNAALNNAVNQGMSTLRKEMANVLGDVMQERAINLTLPRAAVLLFDPQLDITDEVLARLDQRLPSVEFRLEATPVPRQ